MTIEKHRTDFTYWVIYHQSRIPLPFLAVNGIAILPWLILMRARSDDLHRHELTHLYQWRDLWYIGFLPVYCYYAIMQVLKFRDSNPFETEAYAHQDDPTYLLDRKRNAWRRYVREKGVR